MIRVCLVGLGKTGKEIAKVILEQENMKLVSVVCSSKSQNLGKSLDEIIGCRNSGIIVDSEKNLEQVIFKTKPDVVVDFSTPDATIRNAKIFSKMKVNIVVGTTGFTDFALKKTVCAYKKVSQCNLLCSQYNFGCERVNAFDQSCRQYSEQL